MSPHPGIRIHSIPAAGGGGLIFVLGMVALLWLALPAFRPVMAACIAGGLVTAPLLYRAHR
jgi:hypothetical protein